MSITIGLIRQQEADALGGLRLLSNMRAVVPGHEAFCVRETVRLWSSAWSESP